MKRFLALLIAVCMVAGMTACGGEKSGGGGNTGETKDTLNVAYSQDRGTLNPMYNMGYDILNAIRLCYDPLWDWDSEGNRIWKLATGMEMEDEGRTWIIHIREGVKFSNGNPLTADDVVFTIEKAMNREGEPTYFPELDLENTKAIDEYTVSVAFHNYDLSYDTSITAMMIMDKESYDETAIMTEPIGTGPYVLTDYVVNSHLNFEKKEDYWDECDGCQYINFSLFTEDSQKTNGIETGTLDISAVPFQDLDYVQEFENYEVYIGDTSQASTRALYFNTEKSELLKTAEARTAVAMAIDREAIADIVYNGYSEVSRAPSSAGSIDITEDLMDYGVYGTGYDPEGAKELAEKAGLIGKTLTISTNGTSDAITTAECIQSDLNAIGINVQINNYDSGSWLSVAFDTSACGDMLVDFTGTPSRTVAQDISCWYWYHMGGGFTRSEFENKDRFDELCNGIMAVTDQEELHSRYVEMVPIQVDAMLWFSLCDMTTAFAYNSNIEGFQIMRMGHPDYANMHWAA